MSLRWFTTSLRFLNHVTTLSVQRSALFGTVALLFSEYNSRTHRGCSLLNRIPAQCEMVRHSAAQSNKLPLLLVDIILCELFKSTVAR